MAFFQLSNKRQISLRIQHSDLVAADFNQTLYSTASIPAGAIVLAMDVVLATAFSGGGTTAATFKVYPEFCEGPGAVQQYDVFTGATKNADNQVTLLDFGNSTVSTIKCRSAQRLAVYAACDGGHLMSDFTAGDATVYLTYEV